MFLGIVGVSLDTSFMNFNSPNWDTFLVLFYALAVILYSFFASRERLTVVLISIYAALALTLSTPIINTYLSHLGPQDFFVYRAGCFIGSFLLLYLIFSHNMSLRSEGGQPWWQGLVLSALQVGLLMSSILLLLPPGSIQSKLATEIFTNENARSAWMLAPVAAMLVMRRGARESTH